jgi:hypothetical protein
MAGKVIDNSATGALVLIIPIALAIVLILKVWPLLLALVLVGAVLRIWQRYQWLQWSQQIDPIFHQLIQANQGCITPVDLSMKANISGGAARRYLSIKAQEFGIRALEYEDKGVVYYFTTASALNRLLDESDSPTELPPPIEVQPSSRKVEDFESVVEASATSQETSSTIVEAQPTSQETSSSVVEPETAYSSIETIESHPQEEAVTESASEDEDLEEPDLEEPDLEEPDLAEQPAKKLMPFGSLIQIELAQRLRVHSSTIYKRRYDPKFPQWSKRRDPDGIAWEYSEDTREFYPLEPKPEKSNT